MQIISRTASQITFVGLKQRRGKLNQMKKLVVLTLSAPMSSVIAVFSVHDWCKYLAVLICRESTDLSFMPHSCLGNLA